MKASFCRKFLRVKNRWHEWGRETKCLTHFERLSGLLVDCEEKDLGRWSRMAHVNTFQLSLFSLLSLSPFIFFPLSALFLSVAFPPIFKPLFSLWPQLTSFPAQMISFHFNFLSCSNQSALFYHPATLLPQYSNVDSCPDIAAGWS